MFLSCSIESICVSILIGISCDFVIHFTHAYSALPGDASRHARTKSALITMGPSILAAAFTTLAAAAIMLFTTITFFVKFAVVLFFTIVQATVASFVVFIVIADVCGPSRPTYLIDKLALLIHGNANSADSKEQSAFDSQVSDGADQLGTTEPPPSSEGSS
jgi:predicted exporter